MCQHAPRELLKTLDAACALNCVYPLYENAVSKCRKQNQKIYRKLIGAIGVDRNVHNSWFSTSYLGIQFIRSRFPVFCRCEGLTAGVDPMR